MMAITNDDVAQASGRMYWQRRERANGPIEGGKAAPQSYCNDFDLSGLAMGWVDGSGEEEGQLQ